MERDVGKTLLMPKRRVVRRKRRGRVQRRRSLRLYVPKQRGKGFGAVAAALSLLPLILGK